MARRMLSSWAIAMGRAARRILGEQLGGEENSDGDKARYHVAASPATAKHNQSLRQG